MPSARPDTTNIVIDQPAGNVRGEIKHAGRRLPRADDRHGIVIISQLPRCHQKPRRPPRGADPIGILEVQDSQRSPATRTIARYPQRQWHGSTQLPAHPAASRRRVHPTPAQQSRYRAEPHPGTATVDLVMSSQQRWQQTSNPRVPHLRVHPPRNLVCRADARLPIIIRLTAAVSYI